MKRIIIHWTGGTYTPNAHEKECYHFLIDDTGKVFNGVCRPEDNENCYDGKYAAHTGGGNTGSIGVALCCNFGYKNSQNVGKYPMTKVQCESMFKKVAELCKQYNIKIFPETVLTHYEFGLSHPNTESKNKPDINYMPPYGKYNADVGSFIRSKVTWYYERLNKI